MEHCTSYAKEKKKQNKKTKQKKRLRMRGIDCKHRGPADTNGQVHPGGKYCNSSYHDKSHYLLIDGR